MIGGIACRSFAERSETENRPCKSGILLNKPPGVVVRRTVASTFGTNPSNDAPHSNKKFSNGSTRLRVDTK
jgi:hypothetical protein